MRATGEMARPKFTSRAIPEKAKDYIAKLHPVFSASPSSSKSALHSVPNTVTRLAPHLVICPLSVVQPWMNEVEKWTDLKAYRFHCLQDQRVGAKQDLLNMKNDLDIVITSYEMFLSEESYFKHHAWHAIVLDEGQRIKNSSSLISQSLHSVQSKFRMILTGTPLQNNLFELWSLFNWLLPNVFDQHSKILFAKGFNSSTGQYNQSLAAGCREVLHLLMLRRMKSVVELVIPEKEEVTVSLPLAPFQREMYRQILNNVDSQVLQSLAAQYHDKAHKVYTKIKSLLFSLKMCCSHPVLNFKVDVPGLTDNPNFLMESCSKMLFLDKLLPVLKAKGHKVLIFAQYLEVLDILEEYMEEKGYECARLDGSVSRARRTFDMKLFNKPNSNMFCFLLSTRAGNLWLDLGGLGITLTAADTVVFFDSDWNPQMDLQAMARAHRIGQTKKVTVYRLVIQDTVEERILTLSQRKLWLSENITENKNNGAEVKQSIAELISTIQLGAKCMFQSASTFDEFMATPLNTLLDRARGKLADSKSINMLEGISNLRYFEGIVQIRAEVTEASKIIEGKRVKRQRTHLVGNNAVLSSTITSNRQNWEAVPTYVTLLKAAGNSHLLKDASDLKRMERVRFSHQDICRVCADGGELLLCAICPRVYHRNCVDKLNLPLYVQSTDVLIVKRLPLLSAACFFDVGDVATLSVTSMSRMKMKFYISARLYPNLNS